jgi:hypothetical protein
MPGSSYQRPRHCRQGGCRRHAAGLLLPQSGGPRVSACTAAHVSTTLQIIIIMVHQVLHNWYGIMLRRTSSGQLDFQQPPAQAMDGSSTAYDQGSQTSSRQHSGTVQPAQGRSTVMLAAGDMRQPGVRSKQQPHGIRPAPVRHAPMQVADVRIPEHADAHSRPLQEGSTIHAKAEPATMPAAPSDAPRMAAPAEQQADCSNLAPAVPVPAMSVQDRAPPSAHALQALEPEGAGMQLGLEAPWLERMAAIAAAAASAAATAVRSQQQARNASAEQDRRQQPPLQDAPVAQAEQADVRQEQAGLGDSPVGSQADLREVSAEVSAASVGHFHLPDRTQHADPVKVKRLVPSAVSSDRGTYGRELRPAEAAGMPAQAAADAGQEQEVTQNEDAASPVRRVEADAECLASVLLASSEGHKRSRTEACQEQLLSRACHSAAAASNATCVPALQQAADALPPQQAVQGLQPGAAEGPAWVPGGQGSAHTSATLVSLPPCAPMQRPAHQVIYTQSQFRANWLL